MEHNQAVSAYSKPMGSKLKGPKEDNIRVKLVTKAMLAMSATLILLTLLTVYGFYTFDYKNIHIGSALLKTLDNFRIMFTQSHLRHFSVSEALVQLSITLGLAFLTTLIGSVIALILGLFAAQNLSSKRVSNLIKAFVAFIRAVPTILWVLFFAVAAGMGSVATVIGMTFHTVGYLIKAYSESFEEIDRSVIEALMASGAGWWQIVFQAVLPSSVTYLLSWTFIRFEINVAQAIAMGAAAGAGGLGFELYMSSAHYFDIREVGMITYFILTIAVILETFSTRAKTKLKTSV